MGHTTQRYLVVKVGSLHNAEISWLAQDIIKAKQAEIAKM